MVVTYTASNAATFSTFAELSPVWKFDAILSHSETPDRLPLCSQPRTRSGAELGLVPGLGPRPGLGIGHCGRTNDRQPTSDWFRSPTKAIVSESFTGNSLERISFDALSSVYRQRRHLGPVAPSSVGVSRRRTNPCCDTPIG